MTACHRLPARMGARDPFDTAEEHHKLCPEDIGRLEDQIREPPGIKSHHEGVEFLSFIPPAVVVILFLPLHIGIL